MPGPDSSHAGAASRAMQGSGRRRELDAAIMSDAKRFKDMYLGDEYQGVYSFLNEQQGLDEIAALERRKGSKEQLKSKYEEEVESLQQPLTAVKQEVEMYAKGVEHYDRALFQAHKALDVIRTIE